MSKKLNTEDFIKKAKVIHGDRYNYSKVEYTGNKNKVIIICPEHGEFMQKPEKHLTGQGCIKCGFLKTALAQKSNTEEFIEKAKKIHGEKYDYSKTKYFGTNQNVIIICSKHGEFIQKAGVHLMGSGCPKCSGKGKTTQEFINEAKTIHGNKYDYSKTKYITATKKVIIICSNHGEFLQAPVSHLIGCGCPKCGGSMKLTKKEFIERAKIVHGEKYDYSKINYVNCMTKLIIICPEHGEFIQQPTVHLMGCGCSVCAKNNAGQSQRFTTEKFIKKAKEIHGKKYDYSKVEYINSQTKIIIICPEHGEFLQVPNSHLIGCGCDKCGGSATLNTEEFIQKAKVVHYDRYDYSKSRYVKSSSKVIIICPEHGEFKQAPASHLNGAGCPDCIGRNVSTEDFIMKAKEVHGERYDYSKVKYIGSKIPVIIICPEHGEFLQTPTTHYICGCPKCAGKGFKYISLIETKSVIQPILQLIQKSLDRPITRQDYTIWWRSNKEYCRKMGIPSNPDVYYKKNK